MAANTPPTTNANGHRQRRLRRSSFTGASAKVDDGTKDDSASAYRLTLDVTALNDPATGTPTITGTATVGQTLTAATSGIMDADGLTGPTYTYQWIRVATDSAETDISGATSSAYTLVADDEGKTIKVKVSFSDAAGNPETLTSAATAAVAAAGAANAAPTASDRTVTTHEDTDYTFAAANFNFADTDSGATLSSVKIVTLPAPGKGTLKLDGSAIALADLPQTVTTPDHRCRQTDLHPAGERQWIGLREFYLQGQRRRRRQRLRLHADPRRDGAERPGDGDHREHRPDGAGVAGAVRTHGLRSRDTGDRGAPARGDPAAPSESHLTIGGGRVELLCLAPPRRTGRSG